MVQKVHLEVPVYSPGDFDRRSPYMVVPADHEVPIFVCRLRCRPGCQEATER